MSWFPRSVGVQSQVDWKNALNWQCVDPYLVWFDLLGFPRWLRRDEKPGDSGKAPIIPILIELEQPYAKDALRGVGVPQPYLQPLRDAGPTARFVTGRATPAEIAQLMEAPGVRRVQIDMSRTAPQTGPNEALIGSGRAASPVAVWIGVIDDGCAFAHQNFREGDRSRVEYLWDHNPPPTSLSIRDKWTLSTGFGYGREARPSQLDLGNDDELATYERLNYEQPSRSRVRHGTAVMDLAAGAPPPLQRQIDPTAAPPIDAAGQAPIVFVELPHIDERDTCSTSLGVHLLDALRYIVDRVERHASGGTTADPSQRLVVNISYGGLAGPHDGTTIIEQAIDELIEERGNLAVVMAAGNTYQRPPPLRPTHAMMRLGPGDRQSVAWRIQPEDITDSYLEIWFRRKTAPQGICVTVTPPGGAPKRVDPGQAWTWTIGEEAVAAVVFPRQVVQSTAATMALVALAPTVPLRGHPAAPEGPWLIEVKNDGSEEVDVDLWIERDDLVAGDIRRRQQSCLEPRGGQSVDVRRAFSSLAHGRHTVVAGGLRLSDMAIADDSASGPAASPATRERPDVLAPSSLGANALGLKVAGTTSGVVTPFSGTSAAAPSVTRWLANAFAAAPPGWITTAAVQAAMDAARSPQRKAGGEDEYRDAKIRIDVHLKPELILKPKPVNGSVTLPRRRRPRRRTP